MNTIIKASLAIFSFAISTTSSYSMATQKDDFYSFAFEDGRASALLEVVKPEFQENKRWQSFKKINIFEISTPIIYEKGLRIDTNIVIKEGGMICIKKGQKLKFGTYGKIFIESRDPQNFNIKNYIKEVK